ncbi:glucosamine kinase [Mameliella alba]|uniref:BadF/BadG/BcrA/BcrD ATPase family protein n=1 Tax=Mameliella alba TaxID=561184 RepID=UPI000882E4D8|nr:BadF/BadG/BcrA/BcrD ATPase family protein [Mameliella alba]OWV40832.1 ATPase [Mameliella alba]PTR33753.1 glucosamine kinase [Mameliella alba]GGF85336.1 N-acetylglucosamine kinase [Mameliella alba]SDE30509.1 glucosamine kinase [Mameliella alba]
MSHPAPPYLIAVDGGGSGCRAVVASYEGRILGEGRAGPANATSDLVQSIANTRVAIGAALGSAGLEAEGRERFVAHLGLAGALTSEVTSRINRECGLPHATVGDDLETALAGALGSGDGILVSVGTGSVMAGHRSGETSRIGGWGLQVSDQASGAWLGRGLMERVLLCHDGLEAHSDLTASVLAEFGGALEIVAFATGATPGEYATWAPRVVAAADTDAQAVALMTAGAAYLGRGIGVLDPSGRAPVCLTGGLGPAYGPYLPDLQGRIVQPQGTALDGALRLARAFAERRTRPST